MGFNSGFKGLMTYVERLWQDNDTIDFLYNCDNMKNVSTLAC